MSTTIAIIIILLAVANLCLAVLVFRGAAPKPAPLTDTEQAAVRIIAERKVEAALERAATTAATKQGREKARAYLARFHARQAARGR